MALPKIEAVVIPHSMHRYPTVGDWLVNQDGSRLYRVSDMGNADYEFLVLMHEMIEHHLCDRAGITQEMVDVFDKQFEKERAEGKHALDAEPGDDPRAPYHTAHQRALHIERQIASHLGVHWDAYEKALGEMP